MHIAVGLHFRLFLAAALLVPLHAACTLAAEAGDRDFPGDIRLTLPPTIYATPGVETNLYFDNAVLVANSANFIFDVTCEKGYHYDDRWSFTPLAEDAGDHELVVAVRNDQNKVIARARTMVRVAKPQAVKKNVSMLAFGDSHLQRDAYLQRVLDSSVADPELDLVLVGSRGAGNKPPTTELRHEGYNGWTAQAFVTREGPKPRTGFYVPAETASPFLYAKDGKQQLDFRQYCADMNHGQPPDFVVIQVGGNDVWRADDETIDATIDKIFGYFDILIRMVHDASPTTRVALTLLDPPARSQHGFRNYKGGQKQTRWQYRRNQQCMVERQIERYAGRESENVFVLPVNLCIDCVNGFPLREYPINARNAKKELRVYDGCHLSNEGYAQFGDEIFAWMKCCLAEPAEK
jgi:lysophospholipase L1-like esterase